MGTVGAKKTKEDRKAAKAAKAGGAPQEEADAPSAAQLVDDEADRKNEAGSKAAQDATHDKCRPSRARCHAYSHASVSASLVAARLPTGHPVPRQCRSMPQQLS